MEISCFLILFSGNPELSLNRLTGLRHMLKPCAVNLRLGKLKIGFDGKTLKTGLINSLMGSKAGTTYALTNFSGNWSARTSAIVFYEIKPNHLISQFDIKLSVRFSSLGTQIYLSAFETTKEFSSFSLLRPIQLKAGNLHQPALNQSQKI